MKNITIKILGIGAVVLLMTTMISILPVPVKAGSVVFCEIGPMAGTSMEFGIIAAEVLEITPDIVDIWAKNKEKYDFFWGDDYREEGTFDDIDNLIKVYVIKK